MQPDTRDTDAVVVVQVDHQADPIAQITECLERLGITVEVIGRGRQLRRSPAIIVRVSGHQVSDAILALELHGFRDVLAYQADADAR